jgi:hypothetical protein
MLLVRHLGRQSISWVQISEVYNPGSLYVQPFSLLGTDGEDFRKLTEDMNETMPLSTTTRLFKGQMCALRSNDSNGVYRVIIERISRTTGGAQVLLVDTGCRQLVDFKELVPLSVDHFVDPYPFRMAMRVGLYNLEPGQDNAGEWSPDSCSDLKILIGKKVAMYVADECPTTQVLLFEVDDHG